MKRIPFLPLSACAILITCLCVNAAPIGQPVPDIELLGSDGKKHSLAKMRSDGEVLVVGFYSPKCPYNIKRWDRIAAIAKEYTGKPVKFVGINPNPGETLDEVTAAVRKHGIEYGIYRDEGKALVKALDAKGTPHMYLFDQKGVLRYAGAFDDNAEDAAKVKEPFLRNAIDTVLAGKELATPEPKAFIGCTIKD